MLRPGILLVLLFCAAITAIKLNGQERQPESSANENKDNVDIKKVEEPQRMLVTASKVSTTQEETGVSTSVITARDKELNLDDKADEMLRMTPGVTILQSGRKGDLSEIRIRGGEVDHTVMLYDGFKVNRHGGSRQFNFAALDPIGLEQIEIARGPASVLFGSDGVTGAVNVVTQKGEGSPELKASVAGGTYQSDRETVGIQGRHERFSYNAQGARYNRHKATPENSGIETFNYAGRFDYDFNADHTLKLVVRGSEFDKGWYEHTGSGFGVGVDRPDPNDQIRSRDYLLGLEYTGRIVPIWETIARIGHYATDNRNKSYTPNFGTFPNLPGQIISTERRYMGEWRNNITAYEDRNVKYIATFGFYAENEFFNQDDTTGSFFASEVRDDFTDWAVYTQHRLELFNRAFLTFGGRREEDDQFGEFHTGRMDASFLIHETDTRIFGSVGNAFRAPSFLELFGSGFGNAELRPEKNFAYDVGIEQHFWKRKIMLRGTYFHNNFKELIGFDPATFVSVNIAEAETRGFELEGTYRPLRQLSLMGNATLMSTKDPLERRLSRRVPRTYAGRLTVHPLVDLVPEKHNGLDLSLEVLSISNRTDSGLNTDGSFNARARNDGYYKLDLAVSYRFLSHFRAFARIENLTDQKYEDVLTFPADGSNTMGGLEFTWKF